MLPSAGGIEHMYFEVSKADWKLFRERLVSWQEAYMERLTREYIEILSRNADGSEKWWTLEKRSNRIGNHRESLLN